MAVTYISSMFVTNDVALLTFVPLALVIGKTLKMDMERIIILQTLAANLGSMLTPPGNPQNFFCMRIMLIPPAAFLPYGCAGNNFVGISAIVIIHGKDSVLKLELPKLQQPPKGILLLFLGLLLLNIGAVLHCFDKLWALLLTAGIVALCDRRRLLAVDYSLLVTFAGFFVFIGNISHSPW